jgi:putative redox protein
MMPAMSTRKEDLTFPGSQGWELAATLERPEGAPRAFAIFAHCFTCTKDYLAPVRVSRHLAERGIAVLRFDFTGLGQSCGEFSETSFSSNVDDVEAAAAFLRRAYQAPRLLMGHSLGGAAALAAGGRIEEVVAVATLAAPSQPSGLKRLVEPVIEQIRTKGEAEVMVNGRPFIIGRAFLEDLDGHIMRTYIRRLDAALLVMHSPADSIVPIEAAAEIFQAARHPKSFLSLDEADHLLSDRDDAHYIAAVIDAWSSRYLES